MGILGRSRGGEKTESDILCENSFWGNFLNFLEIITYDFDIFKAAVLFY